MFHDHQHVKKSESGARDDAEVAGDDGLGVILEKGCPTLVAARTTGRCGWRLWQILPDRTRRHAQAELQQQFVCNALLTPRGVLASNPADQMLELRRNPRPASLAFPAPVKSEALAARLDEGPRRHDPQRAAAIEA